jgi:elongation factor P hydroxylase
LFSATTISLDALCSLFERTFFKRYNTKLVGGFDEPFYLAPTESHCGEVRFTKDYLRSALHEIAHWCVAGEERRARNDFGYWYAPDGRDQDQQNEFFHVEVLPQTYEKSFCEALGIHFEVSLDNLRGEPVGAEAFKVSVEERFRALKDSGFPPRVQQWREALAKTLVLSE